MPFGSGSEKKNFIFGVSVNLRLGTSGKKIGSILQGSGAGAAVLCYLNIQDRTPYGTGHVLFPYHAMS